MKLNVVNINDNKTVSELELTSKIIDTKFKGEIINQVVNWQLAKRQAGTHQAKGISQVSGTTKKPHRQKGTGKARLGSLRAAQCRGGGIIFGPVTRSHAFRLNKKIRKLAVRMALKQRIEENNLIVLDSVEMSKISTSEAVKLLNKFGNSLLVVYDDQNDKVDNFKRSVLNLKWANSLSQKGFNVYDVLQHDRLLITKEALKSLEQRL
jgi:large subunit ribosomal protein L4